MNGVLGRVSPAVANQDVLLYQAPTGMFGVVTAAAVNRSATAAKMRLAIVDKNDLAIGSVAVVNGGSGYTSKPTVNVVGKATTPAVVEVNEMFMTGFLVNTAGSGYTPGDILTVSGGTGTPATIKVATTAANGGIVTATIVNPGSYTTLIDTSTGPVGVTGGTGTGALLDTFQYGIKSLTLVNPGNGYKVAPTLEAPQTGATGFSGSVQMTVLVEGNDYIEFDVPLNPGAVFERDKIVIGPGQSLFCRASASDALNFFAWGMEEVA